jgi:hypothetical protein
VVYHNEYSHGPCGLATSGSVEFLDAILSSALPVLWAGVQSYERYFSSAEKIPTTVFSLAGTLTTKNAIAKTFLIGEQI